MLLANIFISSCPLPATDYSTRRSITTPPILVLARATRPTCLQVIAREKLSPRNRYRCCTLPYPSSPNYDHRRYSYCNGTHTCTALTGFAVAQALGLSSMDRTWHASTRGGAHGVDLTT